MPLVTKGGRRKREGETEDKGRRGELAAAEDALPFLLLSLFLAPCGHRQRRRRRGIWCWKTKGGEIPFDVGGEIVAAAEAV